MRPIFCILLTFLFMKCGVDRSPKLKFFMDTSAKSVSAVSSLASSSFSVGGTVSGLNGTLFLSLNGTAESFSADGTYAFSSKLNSGSAYTVSVSSYPSGQNCSVTNSSGTVTANVSNVDIACSTGNQYGALVGGTIINTLNLTGNLSTISSGAFYAGLNGITTDGSSLYLAVATNHTILKYDLASGSTSLLAGQSGVPGSSNGTLTGSTFNSPQNLIYYGGYLYVAEYSGGNIRKLDITGNSVTTLQSGLSGPYGMTALNNCLYIGTIGAVKKIDLSTNTISNFVGNGTAGYLDGTGTAAKVQDSGGFSGGLATDGTDLFLGDQGNCAIRKITAAGVITTIAGSAPPTVVCTVTDGIGTSARINVVDGIISDGTNLYFAEANNHIIRKVTLSTMSVNSFAGTMSTSGFVDGNYGTGRLSAPAMLTSDGTKLYIADIGNNALRKVD
ncbi:MAG TPA: hypothetical protein PK453_11505 [Leptospiraceae bacterium]|nr:hypothetical protein [Leptospiraceae bacterium]HNF14289.1 hypothetical protein [Leptospiraceae bacterium]HNI97111.1 hypothetical protein [Leptospiraceae bacterium]HNM05234.1 hypothetical protein [Leptospiraceae bacterium]HNN03801.1 hypothetical protein [Leptospiraceae bacterium]